MQSDKFESSDNAESLHAAYLSRCAPGFRVRRIEWSEGTTTLIDGGQGPPLLLIHGGGGAAFHWGPLLPYLASRFRVLAVDRPGHGLADAFNYRHVDLHAHAHRFIGDVLNREQLSSVTLVGNSMGGLWATAFALREPERVQHLWLVGAPGGLTRHLPLPLRLPAMPLLRGIARLMLRRMTGARLRVVWGLALVAYPERLTGDFLELDAALTRRNAASLLSLADCALDWRGFKPELVLGAKWQALRVPTTFVVGERDRVDPSAVESERVVALSQRFNLVRIPDVGHVPWIDNPAAIAEALSVAQA